MDDGIITIDSSEDETSPEKIKKNNDIIILDEENTSTRHKRKLSSEENNIQIKQEIREAPCHKRIKLITFQSQETKEDIKKNEKESNLDVNPSVENHETNKSPSSSSESLTSSEIETNICNTLEDVVMDKIPNLKCKLITFQSEDTKKDEKNNEIEELESNLDVNLSIQNNETNKNPSSSSQITANSEFELFITACTSCEYNKEYKDAVMKKIPNLRRKFNDADENFINSKIFKKFLIEKTEKLQQKPINAVCIFNDVLRELEAKRKRSINLTDREKAHLEKLYITLRKVYKKIIKLENQEVDFDDDNNSSYIMMQRYRQRLCSIQKKICCYTKENYYSGRYLYRNLDFNDSKYSEINRAINRLYYKNKQFPSFYDINNCIKKCVQNNNNIQLTEDELDRESRRIFEAVGNILQRRRKSELYDSLFYFVEGSDGDPAEKDPEINTVLQSRQQEHKKRIDEVIQKFTERQEGYEEPVLSSDSDDSSYKSENSNLS